MNYFIKRGDQQYGPYTLAVLQQYVNQGNISQDDLARSEAMADWVPVSTIIGNVSVSSPAVFGSAPATLPADPVNLPPKLHWAIVLVLSIVTFGLFLVVWLFVQAAWVRKVRPKSKALFYLIGYIGVAFASGFLGKDPFAPLLQVAATVLALVGIFSMRGDIEDYFAEAAKIDRGLSGVMTFFFSGVYLQYCMNELREAVENNAAAAATA